MTAKSFNSYAVDGLAEIILGVSTPPAQEQAVDAMLIERKLPAKARRIVQLSAAGYTSREIAPMVGICKTSVSDVRKRSLLPFR